MEDFFDRESELPLVRQAMEAHFSQKQSLYTKEQFLHKTKMFLQIFIVQLLVLESGGNRHLESGRINQF